VDQPDTRSAGPTSAKLFENLATKIAAARGAHRRKTRARERSRRQTRAQAEANRTSEARAIKPHYRDGEPIGEIARSYNVGHGTISRLAAEILCSSGLSNGMAVEIFWRVNPTAKPHDRLTTPALPAREFSEHFNDIVPGFPIKALCDFIDSDICIGG
jgi:hypothetical protein